MDNLIQVTPLALEELRKALASENNNELGVRIGVKGGGCSGFQWVLDLDEKMETDLEFVVEDIHIFIDPMSAPYVRGTTLDYGSTLVASGFKFMNPKLNKQCGCGQSFSM